MSSFAIFNKSLSNISFAYNVGMGTTNPRAPLHVIGTAAVIGNVGIGTTVAAQPFHLAGNGFISGNIGIGSSTPGGLLDIVSSSTNVHALRISQANSVTGFGVFVNNGAFVVTGEGRVGIGSTVPLQSFHVETNQYVKGRLGVGVASPATPLHVVGATRGVPGIYNSKATFNPADPATNISPLLGNAFRITLDPTNYKVHEIRFNYFTEAVGGLPTHQISLSITNPAPTSASTAYSATISQLQSGAWTTGPNVTNGATPTLSLGSISQRGCVSGLITIYNKDHSVESSGVNMTVDINTYSTAGAAVKLFGTYMVKTPSNPTELTITLINGGDSNVKGYFSVTGYPASDYLV